MMEVAVLALAAFVAGMYVGRRLVPTESTQKLSITNATEHVFSFTVDSSNDYPSITVSSE